MIPRQERCSGVLPDRFGSGASAVAPVARTGTSNAAMAVLIAESAPSGPPGSGSRSPARSRAARPDSGSLCASSPGTATTGPPVPFSSRARASSRATTRRRGTHARGPSRRPTFAAGVACGAVVISAKDNTESPLRIYGSGSNLADHRLLEVTAGGELILAGGTGNGYRLAELMGATNPSGWAGVLKVKTPAGATAGYILLYSNP